jgi:hypothetical protein
MLRHRKRGQCEYDFCGLTIKRLDTENAFKHCPLRPLSEYKLEQMRVLKKDGGGYYINEEDLGKIDDPADKEPCEYCHPDNYRLPDEIFSKMNYCPNCGRKLGLTYCLINKEKNGKT